MGFPQALSSVSPHVMREEGVDLDMEYQAKTIHFQLPTIALPFLVSDRISTLLTTCAGQPAKNLSKI